MLLKERLEGKKTEVSISSLNILLLSKYLPWQTICAFNGIPVHATSLNTNDVCQI